MNIAQLTFDNIASIVSPEAMHGELAIIDSMQMQSLASIKLPTRMQFFCFLICTSGSADANIGKEQFHILPGSLILLHPGTTFSLTDNNNCMVSGMAFHSRLRQRINLPARDAVCLQMTIIQNPVSILSAEEQEKINFATRQFRLSLQNYEQFNTLTNILHLNIAALFYVIIAILQNKNQQVASLNNSSAYFAKFMQLLTANSGKQQTVAYYASKLCVSAKYLSEIIRRLSGRTASDWIEYAVATEACYQLKYSDNTIKEIAFELNFSTQSSFGKFFKAQFGLSPNEYRNKFA